MMRHILLVAMGGAAGAAGRYLVSSWMHHRSDTEFPIGTLTVNIIGCLLIGLAEQAGHAAVISPAARLVLVTGALGALTTFSTFGHETLHCLENHSWRLAAGNVLANVVIGLFAVICGLVLGRWMWPTTRL